jgi:hypothetical protein
VANGESIQQGVHFELNICFFLYLSCYNCINLGSMYVPIEYVNFLCHYCICPRAKYLKTNMNAKKRKEKGFDVSL